MCLLGGRLSTDPGFSNARSLVILEVEREGEPLIWGALIASLYKWSWSAVFIPSFPQYSLETNHSLGQRTRVYFLKLVIQEALSTKGPKSQLSLYTLNSSESSEYLHSGGWASHPHCILSLSSYSTNSQAFNVQKNITDIFPGIRTSQRRKILRYLWWRTSCLCSSQLTSPTLRLWAKSAL